MRRTARYRSRKSRTGVIILTLVLMMVLLIGIIIGGDEIATRISLLFAGQEESGASTLPPTLDGHTPNPDQTTLGQHTQEMVNSAVSVTRRAIERHNNAAATTP